MKKHLLINGWHIIADCKMAESGNSIIQVVIAHKNSSFHLTFHEQNDEQPKETHVVISKGKNKQTYHLIENSKENWVAMHWLYLPTRVGKYNTKRAYDFEYNSDYRHIAIAFWITPLNSTVSDGRHIYQCLNSNDKIHTHRQPCESFHTLATTAHNELSIEVIETCCFAVKRKKYDLSNRSIDAICNEFLLINKETGHFESQRFIDRSILEDSTD